MKQRAALFRSEAREMLELCTAFGNGFAFDLPGSAIVLAPCASLSLHTLEVYTPMKMVTAIIQPSRLETVKNLLATAGISGITVSDARGVGRQRGRTEIYRGHEYKVDLIPKVKIEIAIDDAALDNVVEAIVKGAKSSVEGKIGDGKIFVTNLEEVVRIRTGEVGTAAL